MDTKQKGDGGGKRGRGRGTENEQRHRGAQHGGKNFSRYDGRGQSGKDEPYAADGGAFGNGSKDGRGGKRGGHERGRGGWHGDRGRGGAHPERGKVRHEETEHGPSERGRGRGGGNRGGGQFRGRGGPDRGRGRGGKGGLRRAGSRSELNESGNIQESDFDGMRPPHSPAGQSVPVGTSSPPFPPPYQAQQFIPPLMGQPGRPPVKSDIPHGQVGLSSSQPCIPPPPMIPPPPLHQGGPRSFSPRPQLFSNFPQQGPIVASYRPCMPQFPPRGPPPAQQQARPTGVAYPMHQQGLHGQPSRDHGTREEFQQGRTRGRRRNESNRNRSRQRRNSSYDRSSIRDESESLYDSDDGDNVSVDSSISNPQELEEPRLEVESDSSNAEEYPDLEEDFITTLMTKPVIEVCGELLRQKGSLGKLLGQREVPPEALANIMHILAQIIQDKECDASQLIKTIRRQTRLLKLHLPQYILRLRVDTDNETPEKLLQQIQAVMVVLQDILNVSNREQAADAQSLLLVIGDALKDMESKDVDIPASMKDLLQSCDNKRKAVVTGTSMKKKRSEPINKFPTSDFPDSDEIRHSDRPPLIPETRDKGLYESTTECINAQLQMTRERFAAAIRERISRYHALYDSNKVSPDELNRVPVYQNVTLRSIVESSEQRIGLTYRVHFDNSPFQSVNWDTSTQLLKGSIVCLSFDHFKTLVYGIVSKRQVKWLRQGVVELHIPHKEDVVSLLVHDKFYMIDCRVMEDGVINVLSTLRLLTDVTMPLQNHFIGMDSPQKAASFCRDDDSGCSYDLSQLVKEEIQHKSAKARATSVPLTDVKCWPEVISSCLDEFQMKAMRAALTQEFTAIAGAPGTGKRYLGLKIIEILLQNRHVWGRSIGSTSCSRADVDSGPILVLSADDSSLDHFLKGVLTFQGKGIIRFGSKSSDPQINAIDASNVARTSAGASKQPGVEELRTKLSQLHRNIKEAKGTILQASSLRPVMDEHHFESISQNGGMAAWILPEEMQDGHAADDTSVGNIHGEEREWTECSLAVAYDPKERAKQGKEKESKMVLRQLRHHDVMKKEKVQCITNLWSLPLPEKWKIYRFWVAMYEQEVSHRILDICQEVDNIMHEVAKGCRASEYSVFRAASVLGMTASATVANHDVLRYVQPRIIIVDQAQDVAEAALISTLSPDCRQLILLGECEPNVEPDVAVSALASRSDVKISFFQRILDKNYAVNNLKIQHRMRPEISKFLKREMYPDLMDGSSVTRFSNVPGVAENVYFLRHGLTGNEASKHEAEFLSELCQYVTLQGHNGDISVLVNSVQQQEQVKEILGKADLQHVVVDLLDTFQGESDLVLFATYGMYQIRDGRLRNEVRMKRALTRARKGLYVISNIDVLAKKSASILTFFEEAERLTRGGPQLTLTCSTHRDQSTLASKPRDIRKRIQLKGCGNTCHARLKCGHSCKLPCHKHDNKQMGNYRCEQPCQKQICAAGHKCTKKCFEKCDKKCNKDSQRELRCGHSQLAPCSLPTEKIQCRSACEKMLPCGHQCPNTCGEECATKCPQYVTSDGWPCGHNVKVLCSDSAEMCPHPCAEELKCGHVCQGTCGTCMRGRLHIACQKPCGRILVCGHQCKSKCSATCPPCSEDCQNKCNHSRCTELCGEECIPCTEHCEWQCPHQSCRQVCCKPCDREPCQQPCTKPLRCGHECIGLCGEPCPKKCRICHEEDVTSTFFGSESEPDARFVELEDCGHVLEVEGLDKWMKPSDTDESENIKLKGCPKCSTPIRKNLRYGNVIKRALADIEAVKQKMMGSTKELKGKRRQLKKNLGALRKSANGGMDESAVERFLDKLDDCNHLETVVSRLNRCNFMKEVIALEKQVGSIEGALREESATKRVMKSLHDIAQFKLEPLSARLDKMKHRLCDGDLDRFAEQQVDDMMSEIIRTGMEIDLAHLLSRDLAWWDKHPVFQTRVMDFDALLASGKPLTLEQESEAKSIITTIRKEQGIEEAPGLGISERERMQVVQAMGLSQGHWFKCREGHIYAIGECGGAMERGQCPECGGTIGGQRHRLTDENRLAGEMDKAQQAAWSKGGAAAPF
ncbi:NFX1-type zinc finger-containing protein 1-like [Diadema setosum]|uniref:NFX1-type zinc finger-containing protein 1-like n=1 Tax=Diadema setosum TaxID=31175 RepID=UPI003B3AE82C